MTITHTHDTTEALYLKCLLDMFTNPSKRGKDKVQVFNYKDTKLSVEYNRIKGDYTVKVLWSKQIEAALDAMKKGSPVGMPLIHKDLDVKQIVQKNIPAIERYKDVEF